MFSSNRSFHGHQTTEFHDRCQSPRAKLPARAHSFSVKSRKATVAESQHARRNPGEMKKNDRDQRPADKGSATSQQSRKMFTDLESEAHLLPNYLKMTNRILKRKLSAVCDDGEFLTEWLDTSERCVAVRQYAELLMRSYHAKYQRELWEAYYYASAMFFVWPSTTTKEAMALNTDLNDFFFLTTENVQQQYNALLAQSSKRERMLHEFEWRQQRDTDECIGLKRLFELVKTLVVHDLYRLRAAYEQKKILFHCDANGYRAVASFYNARPTKDQVHCFSLRLRPVLACIHTDSLFLFFVGRTVRFGQRS